MPRITATTLQHSRGAQKIRFIQEKTTSAKRTHWLLIRAAGVFPFRPPPTSFRPPPTSPLSAHVSQHRVRTPPVSANDTLTAVHCQALPLLEPCYPRNLPSGRVSRSASCRPELAATQTYDEGCYTQGSMSVRKTTSNLPKRSNVRLTGLAQKHLPLVQRASTQAEILYCGWPSMASRNVRRVSLLYFSF